MDERHRETHQEFHHETRRRAIEAFREAFGDDPEAGAQAPGRVNLIGEHTDYNGGYVLPIAIDRATIAVGSTSGSRTHSIVAADLNERWDAEGSPPKGHWASYVTGALRVMGAPPMQIAFASSVPIGGGLSSSAALEASVATLAETFVGAIDPVEKARRCQRAEHEDAGVPCGIMDQMISVLGKAGHAMLLDCRSQTSRMAPVPDDVAIVVANSNVRHALASGAYAERRRACEAAAARLGVPSLREARRRQVAEDPFASHVVSETIRTRAAARALARGDLRTTGRLMFESHASLRDLYRVSCPELDALVEIASRVEGVHGARMTGGGFGGCAIALCEPGAVGALTEAIRSGYPARTGLDADVFTVRASDGARSIHMR